MIGLVSPQQLPVVLYTLALITLAAVVGYWLDRSLFPKARPGQYLHHDHPEVTQGRHPVRGGCHQVRVAHQAEQNYLTRIEQLRTQTQQLTRRIEDVTQRWLDEKGKFHAVSRVFTRGFVQYYNAALGVSDANTSGATAAPGGAGKMLRPTASAGEPLRPSLVTQRDILANITDNGEQCQIWRAQVDGLLDYIEGLQ